MRKNTVRKNSEYGHLWRSKVCPFSYKDGFNSRWRKLPSKLNHHENKNQMPSSVPAGIYLFKINDRNIRTISGIYSNLGSFCKSVSCVNAVSTPVCIIMYPKDMQLNNILKSFTVYPACFTNLQGITSTQKCNTRRQFLDKIYHMSRI